MLFIVKYQIDNKFYYHEIKADNEKEVKSYFEMYCYGKLISITKVIK